MNKKAEFELGQLVLPLMISFIIYLVLTGVLIYLGNSYMDKYYETNDELNTLLATQYFLKTCFAADTNAYVIDSEKFTQAQLDLCSPDNRHDVTIRLFNLQTYKQDTLRLKDGAGTTYTLPVTIWNKKENVLQQGIIDVGYD